MKGLKLYDKILFLVNSLAGILLLFSYLLQYIPPSRFPLLSVLSLGVPLLLIINILFFIYWLLKLKRQVLLSLIILIIGFKYLSSLYNFYGREKEIDSNVISIMNYNVRLFNAFNWLPSKTIREDITEFIETQKPDIITLQEYRRGSPLILNGYYDFNASHLDKIKGGQVIYSKFPIISSGSLEFPDTYNNALFADVKVKNDTVRIYNVHLQSTGIKADVNSLKNENSQNLLIGLANTFRKQQAQSELLLGHMAACPYRIIVSGDFNNTPYSYVYKQIKGDLVDTFDEAGHGFGKTFNPFFFPLRIDFILVDQSFEVNSFEIFKKDYSDHYPIMTKISLH